MDAPTPSDLSEQVRRAAVASGLGVPASAIEPLPPSPTHERFAVRIAKAMFRVNVPMADVEDAGSPDAQEEVYRKYGRLLRQRLPHWFL